MPWTPAWPAGHNAHVAIVGIEIRAFRPSDQDAVRTLVLDGLREHWGEIDPRLNPDLDDIAASYPDNGTIVAVDASRIVGTGTLRRVGATSAEIVRISVAPHYRRTGVGRRLVEGLVALAHAWGRERVILETTSDWHGVVAFYRRCGFALTHEADGEFSKDSWFELQLAGPPSAPERLTADSLDRNVLGA